MKCQILFCGKDKKYISKCRLQKFLSSVLSVKLSIGVRFMAHEKTDFIHNIPDQPAHSPSDQSLHPSRIHSLHFAMRNLIRIFPVCIWHNGRFLALR